MGRDSGENKESSEKTAQKAAFLGNQKGNIFFTLFGAIAVVGLIGAGVVATMRGPLSTMVEVNNRAKAQSEMMIASRLALLEATQLASDGDCDADGFVEPLEWADAAGNGPDGVFGSDGGGFLPSEVGVSHVDPWGTEYGYCAWDAGGTIDAIACDVNTDSNYNRLDGNGGVADETYTVIALISAGPDGVFQTICEEGASPAATKGGDDLLTTYTYSAAIAETGGLWNIKSGDPSTAEIAKDLEVTGGASFTSGIDLSASTAALQLGAASMLFPTEATLNTCNAANDGLMRLNTGGNPDYLEVCDDPTGWVSVAEGAPNIGAWNDDGPGGPAEIYYNGGNVGIGTNDPAFTLDVTGTGNITGALTLGSTLGVTGDATVGGTLGVTGAATLSSTLGVTGATTLSTLNATGAVDFDSTLNVDGATTLVGTLNGQGAVDFDSTLNVDGATTLVSTLDAQGTIANSTGSVVLGDNVDVTGNIDAQGNIANSTGDVAVNDNLAVTGDISATGAVAAGTTISVNGDQLGPAANCNASEKLQWSNGAGWSCVVDLQGGAGGGAPDFEDVLTQDNNANTKTAIGLGGVAVGSAVLSSGSETLEVDVTGEIGATKFCDADGNNCFTTGEMNQDIAEVLTTGNDAGGATNLLNLQGLAIGSSTLSSGSQALEIDVTGDIGAVNYCDASGNNCFTASDIASGGGGLWNAGTGDDIYYNSGTPQVGIGTASPQAILDIAGTGAFITPRGTTGERPGTGVNGMIRYNSTSNRFEGYQAGGWQDILTGGAIAAPPERGIQFNSGDSLAADANFTYTSAGDFIVGSYQLDDTGTGSEDYRMFFDVSKGAFRAGSAAGAEWDDVNVGLRSVAMGEDATASAPGSVAIGDQVTASGTNATTFGLFSVGSGNYSTAMGRSTTASGDSSTAMGRSTTASGDYSTAMGNTTIASGNSSLATGSTSTTASGNNSMAAGSTAVASGSSSMSLGSNTTASGSTSVATGYVTTASGNYSTAMGNATVASGITSMAMGYKVKAGDGVAGSGLGDGSIAVGLIDNAVTITTPSQVQGIQSFGIFMGDQDGLVMSANNTFGLFGGKMVIDPSIPAVELGPSTGGEQDLELDVSGDIGAVNYCDANGNNCFTAAGVASGAAAYGSDGNIQFSSGGTLWSTSVFTYTSAGRLGIGTGVPGYTLDVTGTGNVSGAVTLGATLGVSGAVDIGSTLNVDGAISDSDSDVTVNDGLIVTGDLTVSGDDLIMGTNTDGAILVADGTNFNPVVASGDATIGNDGTITLAADAIEEGMLKAVDVAADEECLTYETTTGDFEWQTCGGSGSIGSNTLDWDKFADAMTLDAGTTIDMDTNTADLNFDGNTLFIDSSANAVGIGTVSPATVLDVAGAVRVDYDAAACDGTIEGSIRYDSGGSQFDLCDGASWKTIATSAGGSKWTAGTGDAIYYNSGTPLVGIGTGVPGYTLDVTGTGNVSGAVTLGATLGVSGAVDIGSTLNVDGAISDSDSDVTVNDGLIVTGDLTVSGDDLIMGTNTDGAILVADGTNFNPVVASGDATIGNDGTITLAADAIEEGMLKAVDVAADEECLTYETTTGDFEWQTCGGSGSIGSNTLDWDKFADAMTLDAGTTIDMDTNTADLNFDGNTLFIDSSANAVGIGTVSPATVLDVAGAVRVDYDAAACDGTIEGSIRYDSGGSQFDLCDGASWKTIATSAGGSKWTAGTGDAIYYNSGTPLVGIGTGVPGYTLDVTGTGNVSGAVTLGATLGVSGAVDIGSTLNVDGAISDSDSDVTVNDGLIVTGDLTVSGDDLIMGTNTDGAILVADGTNFNPVVASGDATIGNDGTITLAADAIEEGMLKAVDVAADEECLTYETTTGDFEWQTCGGSGSIGSNTLDWDKFADAMTLDAGTTIDMDTNTADLNFDGNTLFIDSSANAVGIGTVSPATVLDVAGAVRVDYDAAACDGTIEGSIRYDSGGSQFDLCDGASWKTIATSAGGSKWTAGTGDAIYYNSGTPLVGIGTGVPGYTLDVTGTGNVSGAVTLGATLGVSGAVDIGSTLNVDGAISDSDSDVTVNDGLIVTGDLTVSGDDLIMGTNTDGAILVADGTNFNPVVASGDATIGNDGTITLAADAIEEGMLKAVDVAADEECLTYETTTGDFEWQTCGGSGSIGSNTLDWDKFADAMTLDAGTTIDMDTNTADLNFDGNTLFIDSSANAVGIGTVSPATVLDVAGAVRVDYDAAACDGTIEGSIRYDSGGSQFDLCDGASWKTIATSAGGSKWTAGTGDAIYYNSGTPLVGIGTGVPGYTLDVTGTGNVSGAVTLGATLGVSGAVDIGSTLNVDGAISDSDSDVTVNDGLIVTGDLTVSGDDLIMGTNTDGAILVADGTNFNPVVASGDATIGNDGTITLAADAIEEGMLKAVDVAADEECLTYETTTGDFEWQTCGGSGSIGSNTLDWDKFADAMTLDAGTTIDMDTNTADLNFDGNTLFIDSSANAVGIGTVSPATVLDVAGAVRVDYDAAACDGTIEGSIRYDSGGSQFDLCDGASWKTIATSAGGSKWTAGTGDAIYYNSGTPLVGIGTGVPGYTLDVTGTGNVSGAVTLGATLGVSGAVDIGSTLNVDGAISDSDSDVTVNDGLIVTGDLTVSGDDLIMGTNTDGAILVADGTNFNPVVASGDATIGNDGTITLAADAIEEGMLKAVDVAADEECLTYETTTGDFEWQTCGGSVAIVDLTDSYTDYATEHTLIMARAGAGALAAGAQYNTFVGEGAGATTANSTATTDYNTAFGYGAMGSLIAGFKNTAIGANALAASAGAENNTAVGYAALLSNTSGHYNVSVGADSMQSNTGGHGNIAIGYEALKWNLVGDNNTAIGRMALRQNKGNRNTAIGRNALFRVGTGEDNIAIGYDAGYNNDVNATTTGTGNILIGKNVTASTGGAISNYLNIGDSITGDMSTGDIAINGTGALTVPSGTTAQQPGTAVNGMIRYNTDTPGFEVREAGAWVAMGASVSDRRLKTGLQPLDGKDILARISQINTYSYVRKDGASDVRHLGVVAQEIEKIFPEVVSRTSSEEEIKSVDYRMLTAPLIEAVKTLKTENETLRAELEHIKTEEHAALEDLRRDVDGLKAYTGYGVNRAQMGLLALFFMLLGGVGVLIVDRRQRRF